MGLASLVGAELRRRPERTIFTIVSLAVGFLLFGLLQGVNSAFGAAVSRTKANRLMIDPRFDAPMPLGYANRIERIAGVEQVTWTHFLFGYYQDPKQLVPVIATAPTRFFTVRNEYKTSAADLSSLMRTRTGLIVLDTLAKRFGWKAGDHVSLVSSLPRKDGGHTWTFDIVGVMTAPGNPGQLPFAVANYEYFDEARQEDTGTVTRFIVRISDPQRAAAVAHSIDAVFANSSVPTITQEESEFASRELAQIGDVGRLTDAVIIAVFFAMLFLTGNVVLQSVRERTPQFAVLKTLGFSDERVLTLVGLEALALCLCGAVIGLALAEVTFHFVGETMAQLTPYLRTTNILSAGVILEGVAAAAILTVVAAALPAWTAKRLDIVEAMRVRV